MTTAISFAGQKRAVIMRQPVLKWDIYLFGAPSDLSAENLSQLSASNDLSSPDGLYF